MKLGYRCEGGIAVNWLAQPDGKGHFADIGFFRAELCTITELFRVKWLRIPFAEEYDGDAET